MPKLFGGASYQTFVAVAFIWLEYDIKGKMRGLTINNKDKHIKIIRRIL